MGAPVDRGETSFAVPKEGNGLKKSTGGGKKDRRNLMSGEKNQTEEVKFFGQKKDSIQRRMQLGDI